jgi:hypothetical protein
MSSTLRLSIIMVLLLATAALGLIAYNMNLPKPVVQVTENTPAPVTTGYFAAAHPLQAGTLARDEDFTVRSVPSDRVPSRAILDTPDAKINLRGSLVRTFLDTGSTVTSQDVLRPRDRGFLASVLAPGSRAISINVDAESGVSGRILEFSPVVRQLVREKIEPVHPLDPTIRGVSHVMWTDKPRGTGAHGRNAVFYGSRAIDRSPCGTGTSARLAHLHAKGRLRLGDVFVHESYIGNRFIGRIEEKTWIGDRAAIVLSIEGSAIATGFNQIWIDDEDQFARGFQVK